MSEASQLKVLKNLLGKLKIMPEQQDHDSANNDLQLFLQHFQVDHHVNLAFQRSLLIISESFNWRLWKCQHFGNNG